MNMTPEEMTFVGGLAFVVLGAVVLCWAFYWDYRKRRLLHEERRAMIEKGLQPPPLLSGLNSGLTISWPQVKQHEQQLRYEERRLRIEKGMDVPPEETKPMTPEAFLRRGLIWFCLGLGGVIAYVLVDFVDRDAQSLLGAGGIAIGLYGLGNLAYYLLIPRQSQRDAKT
jgi:hypothetical protein